MSFKLDLSGLFGGGGFALDPSKFDFSGLTFDEPAVAPTPVVPQQTAPVVPQQATPVAPTVSPTDSVPIVAPQPVKQPPKVVTRPDPVAIVTQQSDPIADAIASVQSDVVIPKVTAPTGMDFGIAPINPTPIANIGNLGGVSGFDVPASAVDNLLTTAKTNEEILNPLVSDIEKFGVGSGQAGLIPTSTAKELKDYVTTDEFSDIVDQYSKVRTGVSESEWEGAASRDVLDALNIPYSFETQDDFGRTSVYNFNEQTNSFDLVEEYGGTSALNEGIKTIAETAATVALTGGLGAGLASGLGVSTATGVGLVTGGVSLAQGDDLDEAIVKGLTAGLSEHAKGAAEALEAAEAAGESVEVIKGLQATSDVASNIKNVVNIGQAIESGDVLKGLSNGMELAGIGSLVDYTEDVIAESLGETAGMGIDGALTEWAFYNSDHIAEATVKFADTLVKGGDLGDATVGAVKEYIKDGGGLSDLVPSGGDFDLDLEVPEVVEQVAQAIADGASAINRNVIKPAIEGADQVVRALPTTKEDWQEAETFVKENTAALREDFSNLNRDVRQELADFDETYLQPIKEDMSQINEQVREDLANFDETYLQPAKETIVATAEGIETYYKDTIEPSIEQGIKDTKEMLADFDKNVTQRVKNTGIEIVKTVDQTLSDFNKEEIKPIVKAVEGAIEDFEEQLRQFDENYLQEIKDAGEAGIAAVDDALSDFNKNTIKPALQSIEDALGDIDADTSGLEDMVKGLFQMFDLSTKATQGMITAATAPTYENVDLVTAELINPELTKGFEYDSLQNPFLKA